MGNESKNHEKAAFSIFFGAIGSVGLLCLAVWAFGKVAGILVFCTLVAATLFSLYYISDESNACGPDRRRT